MTKYTVVYGSGGRVNTTWHRALLATTDIGRASRIAQAEVRAGRPAFVKTLAELDAHGMPEGACPNWDYSRLCWGVS